MGQAQTGTGKTAAFLLPFINAWKHGTPPGPQALVLVPTRELAIQVAEEAHKLSPHDDLISLAVYGGQKITNQLRILRAA